MGREKQFARGRHGDEDEGPELPGAAPVRRAAERDGRRPGEALGLFRRQGRRARRSHQGHLVDKGMAPEDIAATLGDPEIGSYLGNEIPLGEGEFDVDAVIGWSREHKVIRYEGRRSGAAPAARLRREVRMARDLLLKNTKRNWSRDSSCDAACGSTRRTEISIRETRGPNLLGWAVGISLGTRLFTGHWPWYWGRTLGKGKV